MTTKSCPRLARSSRPALPALIVLAALLAPSLSQAVQLGQERPGSLLSGATMNVSETFYYKFNLFLDDNKDDGVAPRFPFTNS